VKLVDRMDIPDMWKILIHAVAPGIEHVPIRFGEMAPNTRGKYQFGKGLDLITLSKEHLNPNKPWDLLIDATHEGSHARVATTIDTQPQLPAVRALGSLFDYVKDRFQSARGQTSEHIYGLKNVHEFVAEVRSNPRFADELRAFELPKTLTQRLAKTLGEKDPNLFKTGWRALTTLYGKIMGVPPEGMRAFAVAHDLVSRLERHVTPAERARSNARYLEAGKTKLEYKKAEDISPRLEGTKVTDEQGRPLRVYHGTNQAFEQHGTPESVAGYNKTVGITDGEFYFTSSPENAGTYATGEGGNIRPEYLNLQNPYVTDAGGAHVNAKSGNGFFGGSGPVREAIGKALDGGHDGVIVKNVVDPMTGNGKPSTVYVAFKQKQIVNAADIAIDRAMVGRAGPDDAPRIPAKDIGPQEVKAAVELAHGDISNIMRDNQSGAISAGMLGVLGVATAGGLATWLLTENPWTAATAAVAAGTIGALGTRGVRSMLAMVGFHADQRYRVSNLTNRYNGGIAVGRLDTYRMQVYLDHIVPDKARQKVIRDWLEGDDAHRAANPLSALERAYADAIALGFKELQTHVKMLGLDEKKFLERYLTHLYVPGVNTNQSVWANIAAVVSMRNEHSAGMSPHSRFTMKRSIPTYVEAEQLGLVAITNNPAEILRIYADNVNQALHNKLLIDALLRERTPWGERAMMVDMPEAAMRLVIQRDAIHASQYQMSPQEKRDLQAMHASIRAPADFVTIDHPQMRGLKVNKDLEPALKHLFDSRDPNAVSKALYGLAMAAKASEFSFSLFHAKSLMDVLLGTATLSKAGLVTGTLAAGAALATGQDSPLGYFAAGYLPVGLPLMLRKMHRGNRAIKDINAVGGGNATDPLGRTVAGMSAPLPNMHTTRMAMNQAGSAGVALREGVYNGLQIGGRPEGGISPFTRALDLFSEKYPLTGAPVKVVSLVAKKLNDFLWEYVHPSMKAAIFLQEFETQLRKFPNAPRDQLAQRVASYTNDSFGGLDWFRIADGVQNKYGRDLALALTSPSGRRGMQTILAAPDWLISTFRAVFKAIPGVTERELGALHRTYVARSILMYATIADGVNMMLSGHHFWENDDPTTIETKDCRRIQGSKHAMEFLHWITKPGQQALNKLGYVISEPLKLALNSEYLSTRGAPKLSGPGPEKKHPELAGPANTANNIAQATRDVAAHMIKGISPITAQQTLTNTPLEVLSGFAGAPVYGKSQDQAVQEARQRAEKEGRDPTAAEQRARRTYQKKQKEREAKHR
jgi:hypothetical protein